MTPSRGPAAAEAFLAGVDRTPRSARSTSSPPQRPHPAGDRLCHPHGARRADARGNARRAAGLVPRFELAAGAGAAPSRLAARFVSGYLIQLEARPDRARWPAGTERRFHRPARLVRGLSARRRLDRARPDLGPADRRRATSRWPPRRTIATPRRSSGGFRPGQCRVRLRHEGDRVAEHPRITKPFSDESWAALDALGEKVDADAEGHDVRLTMGGEPTFVSIDDFEAANGTPARSARPSASWPTS
jgi:hypothetical protein